MILRQTASAASRVIVGSALMYVGYHVPSHFNWYSLTGYYLGTALILAGATLALSIF